MLPSAEEMKHWFLKPRERDTEGAIGRRFLKATHPMLNPLTKLREGDMGATVGATESSSPVTPKLGLTGMAGTWFTCFTDAAGPSG